MTFAASLVVLYVQITRTKKANPIPCAFNMLLQRAQQFAVMLEALLWLAASSVLSGLKHRDGLLLNTSVAHWEAGLGKKFVDLYPAAIQTFAPTE